MTLPRALELPERRRLTVQQRQAIVDSLGQADRWVLESWLRGDPRCLDRLAWFVRSRTRVDLGYWLRRCPLRLAISDVGVLIWAVGPRVYQRAYKFEDLAQSVYNTVTSRLVLAPAPDLAVRSIRMSIEDAQQVLAHIYRRGFDHA